jgi:hypothetical protein
MAWIETGFPKESDEAFAVFRDSPRFRRPAALPVTREINDHETVVSGDPFCNRFHQINAAPPSVQEENTASVVSGRFVGYSDAVNLNKHITLLPA